MRMMIATMALGALFIGGTPVEAATVSGPMEMQQQRPPQRAQQGRQQQGRAMTPQQMRMQCWREAGFPASTRNFPPHMLPQIQQCVDRRMAAARR